MAAPLILALLPCGVSLAQGPGSDRLIQFYEGRAARDPEDYTNFDRLGSGYLQKARETGDPVYYELSEKAYVQAMSLLSKDKPEAAGTTAHLAALYLAEHRFSESLQMAQRALALDPQQLSAYATVGDAYLEKGQYDEARAAYAKLKTPANLLPPRPGLAYLSETRQANLDYILGHSQAAIHHMKVSLANALEAQLPKENIAWTQFSLGEMYFGTGDYANAEAAYQAALNTYPGYHRALAWLGQLRAAQGSYSEAAELYGKAIRIIPLPLYVAALGDVYTKMGKKEEARKRYELVELIARLSALNQKLFRRELASFYADHNVRLLEALELARDEIEVRQDVYTWDVLAWAYFKNGKGTEAGDAITHALGQGTRDAMLFFHAGMIYDCLGDYGKAKEFLERALAINPRFHIFYSDTAAQTLSRLSKNRSDANARETSDAR